MNQPNSRVRDDRAFDKAMEKFSAEPLEFLIRLAESDPAAIASGQPGDLPNLIYRLYTYQFLVMSREPGGSRRETDECDRLTEKVRRDPELLRPPIESVRKVLCAAADGGLFEWPLERDTKLIFDGAAEVGSGRRVILSDGKAPPFGLEQAITVRAIQYLGTDAGAMIRRCARSPSCQRIFLAARPKQVFCSRQCAASAAFERHKKKLGERRYRTEHRKTARESYRKRRREQGHKVKERIKGDRVWKGPKGA